MFYFNHRVEYKTIVLYKHQKKPKKTNPNNPNDNIFVNGFIKYAMTSEININPQNIIEVNKFTKYLFIKLKNFNYKTPKFCQLHSPVLYLLLISPCAIF